MLVSSMVSRIRTRLRDPEKTLFPDAVIIDCINETLSMVHRHMESVGSVLIYSEGQITTTDGTAVYSVSVAGAVVNDDTVYLDLDGTKKRLSHVNKGDILLYDEEQRGQPTVFYFLPFESGAQRIGFWPVPDGQYVIGYQYRVNSPSLTVNDIGGSTITPYNGIWDDYIVARTIMVLQETVDAVSPASALMMVDAYGNAMAEVYRLGIRRMTTRDRMFLVRGT